MTLLEADNIINVNAAIFVT